MAWLFISIPLMVLAVAVAVVPITWQSLRMHRHEHGVRPLAPESTSLAAHRDRVTAPASVGADCPLCAAHIRGVSTDELVAEVERHARRVHGIPSAQHITESVRVA
jgi:predicted small metal-binding protein